MNAPTSPTNPFITSLKQAVSRPAFLAAFVVLFVAALSLNGATQYMKLYFKKQPVPLAKALELIPQKMGPWVQVSTDRTLDPEMLDMLGTKQYVFRNYVDSRVVPAEELAAFQKMTAREKDELIARIEGEHPNAVMRAAVTYYTGLVDTVAHIPDRCYVADGFDVGTYQTLNWMARDKDQQPLNLEVHYIGFEQAAGKMSTPVMRNVAYFFQCNGDYVSDPVVGVRFRLQKLTERHGYYAKIELMNLMKNHDQAALVMQDFLTCAMPEIEQCLPDWQKVKASEK